MASRILIFDHFCRPLTEISADTTPRSWVLNDHGRAEFSVSYDPTMPQSSQIVREEWFQFGNLIHIIHVPSPDDESGGHGTLPEWTGIILPPQTWETGELNVTAYSAEAILMFRAVPHWDVTGTPKTVLNAIM